MAPAVYIDAGGEAGAVASARLTSSAPAGTFAKAEYVSVVVDAAAPNEGVVVGVFVDEPHTVLTYSL